jgi:hypothetical protein
MPSPSARDRQPTYICEMMELLGIEPGGGVVPRLSLSYATAFRLCEACPSKKACRDWLDRMPRSVAFAPRFCPSADILFELKVDQPICNRTRSHIESENITRGPAHIADLERLEDEIDENLIRKSPDDSSIVDLKCRRLYLRNEIDQPPPPHRHILLCQNHTSGRTTSKEADQARCFRSEDVA